MLEDNLAANRLETLQNMQEKQILNNYDKSVCLNATNICFYNYFIGENNIEPFTFALRWLLLLNKCYHNNITPIKRKKHRITKNVCFLHDELMIGAMNILEYCTVLKC